MKAAILIL